VLTETKKPNQPKFFLRQLGHLKLFSETRRFPSPSHGGFGFIGRIQTYDLKKNKTEMFKTSKKIILQK
jgi:hypothetical protein